MENSFKDELDALTEAPVEDWGFVSWGTEDDKVVDDAIKVIFERMESVPYDDIEALNKEFNVREVQPQWMFSRTVPDGAVVVIIEDC